MPLKKTRLSSKNRLLEPNYITRRRHPKKLLFHSILIDDGRSSNDSKQFYFRMIIITLTFTFDKIIFNQHF